MNLQYSSWTFQFLILTFSWHKKRYGEFSNIELNRFPFFCRQKMFKITVVCFLIYVNGSISEHNSLIDSLSSSQRINFEIDFKNVKKLHRFWTNTGFCPPPPTNDSTILAGFFLSEKSLQNMEYISALPNNGLKYVRIHWLLNLIKFMWVFRFTKVLALFLILSNILISLAAPTIITIFNLILRIWTKYLITLRKYDCIRLLSLWEILRIDFSIKNS